MKRKANTWVQAMPDWALQVFVAQVSGTPDAAPSAAMNIL